MKEAIGTGKTMEEAVQAALQQLTAEREEVEIDPLEMGKKGFLGIGKRLAQVRAKLREDDRIRAIVFLRNILSHMKIETEMDIQESGPSLIVTLGEEASPLIGHRGQTLDALQYLLARFLNEDKEEWRKVVIDIDNYRNRREDDLRELAARLADQVKRTKRDIKTEPLTAPERRIIHLTLKENSGITTFSIGDGARKRVVIALADRQSSSRRRSPRRGGGSGGKGRGKGSGRNYSGGRKPREDRYQNSPSR